MDYTLYPTTVLDKSSYFTPTGSRNYRLHVKDMLSSGTAQPDSTPIVKAAERISLQKGGSDIRIDTANEGGHAILRALDEGLSQLQRYTTLTVTDILVKILLGQLNPYSAILYNGENDGDFREGCMGDLHTHSGEKLLVAGITLERKAKVYCRLRPVTRNSYHGRYYVVIPMLGKAFGQASDVPVLSLNTTHFEWDGDCYTHLHNLWSSFMQNLDKRVFADVLRQLLIEKKPKSDTLSYQFDGSSWEGNFTVTQHYPFYYHSGVKRM